jgi:hypothetical protein
MGPLRRFEDRLEKIFEGPFTKAFKGGVHPLEIARRMIREVDDGRVLGVNETLAPNDFKVHLSPRDYDRLSGMLDSLAVEMESLIIAYSNKRDYHLIKRPHFEFESDGSLDEGEFSVRAVLDEPARAQPPAGREGAGPQPAYSEGRLGVLAILKGEEGFSYPLERARTRIGRADENDLVLADLRASRFHAEIERTPRGYVVRDLGSTNGTMVGGRIVQERLLENGDTLTMGETEMRFDLIAGQRKR